ncbi:MAG: nucleotidyltransferase family protein [Ginsengibacter sp.]
MVSAVILAAGSSARMGAVNKLLLPFRSKTIIEIVTENIIASGIEEVIVVLGYEGRLIQAALQHLPVNFVNNSWYEKGMTTSIQQGIGIANGNGYMICLGDMLKISPAEYASLVIFFENTYSLDPACICIPACNLQKGNPVIFASGYKEAILQCAFMEGCRDIVQSNKKNLYLLEMSTDHVLSDLDYKEDYEKLL